MGRRKVEHRQQPGWRRRRGRGCRLFGAVESAQIQVEADFFGHRQRQHRLRGRLGIQRRHPRRRQGRHIAVRPRAGVQTEVQVAGCRQVRHTFDQFGQVDRRRHRAVQRLRQPQWNPQIAQAQRIGGLGHVGRLVAALFVVGDGLDPAGHVVQRFFGEGTQRRVQPCAVRQAGVEQLLASPGGLAEIAQADHAAAALERVEGAAQHRHLVRRVGAVGGRLHRGMRIGEDLARLFDEDVAHLGVVFEPGVSGGNRPRRRHRRGGGQRRRRRRRQPEQALRQLGAQVAAGR